MCYNIGMTTPTQPEYKDCSNCGSADHNGYSCPCTCHGHKKKTAEPFGIYVNVAHGELCGYLAGWGGVSPWCSDAASFSSQAEAEAEIHRRGWLNSTGVQPGTTTAYVCCVARA